MKYFGTNSSGVKLIAFRQGNITLGAIDAEGFVFPAALRAARKKLVNT